MKPSQHLAKVEFKNWARKLKVNVDTDVSL